MKSDFKIGKTQKSIAFQWNYIFKKCVQTFKGQPTPTFNLNSNTLFKNRYIAWLEGPLLDYICWNFNSSLSENGQISLKILTL